MLKNGAYNAFGTAFSMLVSILAIPVLVRVMGVGNYGIWTLVVSLMGVVALAEAGISTSTTAFFSADLARDDLVGAGRTLTTVLGAIVLIALVASAALAILAPTAVGLFVALSDEQKLLAAAAIRISAIAIAFRLIQQVLLGLLQAMRHYRMTSLLGVVQSLLLSAGAVGVVWAGGRVIALVRWQVMVGAGMLAVTGFLVWLELARHRIRFGLDGAKTRAVLKYAGMSWLVSLSTAMFSQCDRLIVGGMLGVEGVGVYGAITSIAAKINSLSAAAVQPIFPELNAALASGRTGAAVLSGLVRRAFRLNVALAFGLGIGLYTLAPVVWQIVMGAQGTPEGLRAMEVGALIYALYSPNAVGFYVMMSTNLKRCIVIQIASATLALLAISVLGLRAGLMGATVGNAGYMLIWLLSDVGMKEISVERREWLGWLRTSAMVLIATVMITELFVYENRIGRTTVGAVAMGAIVLWFWLVEIKGRMIHRDTARA